MENKLLRGLLVCAVIAPVFSVFAFHVFYTLALLSWVTLCVRERRLFLRKPPFWLFIVLLVITVLLSILFSVDAVVSAGYLRKLPRFFLPFLIYTFLSPRDIRKAMIGIVSLMSASAMLGITQYYWLMDVDLLNRIHGFMGHWMTFSGQLMLTATMLLSCLLHWKPPGDTAGLGVGPRFWSRYAQPAGWLILGVILWALLLTMTRNAWLGTGAGFVVILCLFSRRAVLAFAVMLVLLFWLVPGDFRERLYSGMNVDDETTRVRIELLQTGKNMVWSRPWTGVGPRMVPRVSTEYRANSKFPDWIYQHLHNTPLQIAAETGLLGLGAWLLLCLAWVYGPIRLLRTDCLHEGSGICQAQAIAAVAAVAALFVAGLFEYNFGDSEILVLLLFLVTAPHVFSSSTAKIA
ncbi:MAG: O-antigen ligase family protein [Acidobacteria bacterium]|nr:O-antigen ligase family protein [Acidobacteriota bacterium]